MQRLDRDCTRMCGVVESERSSVIQLISFLEARRFRQYVRTRTRESAANRRFAYGVANQKMTSGMTA